MTTSPVMTVTDELLADIQREFNRNAPCSHENYEHIGGGNWIRCDDCGRTVDVDFLEGAKESAEKNYALSSFLGEAFAELRRLRAENAELAKDAGRYEWTLHQAWFQSAFERYDPEDDGTQGLFESECRKITDIAMCR